MKSILIVGAGIAGLSAARTLKQQGYSVTVLDKGRGVGGRLNTRSLRIEGFGDAIGDRGAQYFTVRDERFTSFTDELVQSGIVREWSGAKGDTVRYVGIKGMREIANYLAQNMDVRTEQRVTILRTDNNQWNVETDMGLQITADALLMTPPVPQSLAIFDASRITLPDKQRQVLEKITYNSCLTLMVLLEGDSKLSGDYAELQGETLRWIADNKRKGISVLPVLTLHSTHEFSQKHWQKTDEEIAEQMLHVAKPFVGSSVVMYKVHRWRYSEPSVAENKSKSEPFLSVQGAENIPPLVFAGDGFTIGRVESAWLSGLAAAESLVKALEA